MKTNPHARSVAAVIFDMDGVIIDTEGPVQTCCQQAAAEMGLDLDDEFYVSALVGRGWDDCDAALVERFGAGFSLAEFRERFQRLWTRRLDSRGIDIKPGFVELFAFLRSLRISVAVATSTHRADAHVSLRAARIEATFDAFVTGDEVQRGKPDPEIYLTAASMLGLRPSVCIAVEDSSAGVLAATRAGIRTLLIPDGGRQPTPEAADAAFRILPSLFEARAILSDLIGT